MRNLLITITLLFLITSCSKEQNDYDVIQLSVVAKDSITIKYFNGVDTITRKTLFHFSTSYNLIDNNRKIPVIRIKGTIISYRLYINGNVSEVYVSDTTL
jgi:uncharacterized protein YcfL